MGAWSGLAVVTGSHSTPGVVRSLIAGARSDQLTFLAAAIAYYAFVSTIPLAIVGVAAATAVGGETFAAAVLARVDGLLTPQASGLVSDALTSGAGRSGATLLGLAVLGWSGLRLFRGLDVAFSIVYGASARDSLANQVRDGLLALGAMAVAGVVIAGVVTALTLVDGAFPTPAAPVIAAITLPLVFLPLYLVFPDHPIGVREALPGAVVAGVGWTLLAAGFSLYATYASPYQLYGVVGGVLLALTWFYAGGLLVLLGAHLNAVLAAGTLDRQLQHEPGPQIGHAGPMSERDDTNGEDPPDGGDAGPEDVAELRRELDALAADLEAKTTAREDLEADLRGYVRRRQRRGHARGWGPYLVLLYGTVMTLGGFYFLSGGWAILAMLVIWLSTLGLYVLMVIVGVAGAALGLPGRLTDRLRNLR